MQTDPEPESELRDEADMPEVTLTKEELDILELLQELSRRNGVYSTRPGKFPPLWITGGLLLEN